MYHIQNVCLMRFFLTTASLTTTAVFSIMYWKQKLWGRSLYKKNFQSTHWHDASKSAGKNNSALKNRLFKSKYQGSFHWSWTEDRAYEILMGPLQMYSNSTTKLKSQDLILIRQFFKRYVLGDRSGRKWYQSICLYFTQVNILSACMGLWACVRYKNIAPI